MANNGPNIEGYAQSIQDYVHEAVTQLTSVIDKGIMKRDLAGMSNELGQHGIAQASLAATNNVTGVAKSQEQSI